MEILHVRTYEIRFCPTSGLCLVEALFRFTEPRELVGVFYTVADAERAFPYAWVME